MGQSRSSQSFIRDILNLTVSGCDSSLNGNVYFLLSSMLMTGALFTQRFNKFMSFRSVSPKQLMRFVLIDLSNNFRRSNEST